MHQYAHLEALAVTLLVAAGKPPVKPVNGKAKSLQTVLPLAKDRGAAVIGLTVDDDGSPDEPVMRLTIAERILEQAAKVGIPSEDVILIPS